MTREEAIYEIRHVNVMIVSKEARNMAIKALEQDSYQCDGCVNEDKEALLKYYQDKDTVKKVIKKDKNGYPHYRCGGCGKLICVRHRYCHQCGQKINENELIDEILGKYDPYESEG